MKRSLSKRHWIFALAILLMLGLAACERPLHEEIESAPESLDPSMLAPEAESVDPYQRSLPLLSTEPTVPEAYPGPEMDMEVVTGETVEEIPVAPEVAEPLIYEVQSGDILVNIARQYDVTVEEIAAASGLANVDVLEVGQRLVIPVDGMPASEAPVDIAEEAPAVLVDGETVEESVLEEAAAEESTDQIHVVQFGDNLFRIGLLYGCKHEELAIYNNLANPDSLDIGQEIRIPNCE